MADSNSNTRTPIFSHLTLDQRGQIKALREEGRTMQYIAGAIGVHKSTVSRELKRGAVTQRNTDWTEYEVYFPDAGQRIYDTNRSHCGATYKFMSIQPFLAFATACIKDRHWSPDVAVGVAKKKGWFDKALICTRTLYHYIDIGLLSVRNIDLPLKVKRSTKTKRHRQHRKVLGKSIEERPSVVDDRTEFGHWEIDTVLGKRAKEAALLTLTERQTRREIIYKIGGKDAPEVRQALTSIQETFGETFSTIFKTITSDNGSEFADLSNSLKNSETEVYYTHPYTSSERGTNERHNGLIRRFIPKGQSMEDIPREVIQHVETWCNTLPRKILGYQTPEERFQEEVQKQALS
ncbi:IS30 family transposase [Salimicrobium salexigens]|uniref:Transposase and inactivated derivatives, IS30 family n=1 Tax=Salimicrobium salexigens TaxID=908941 RepID=A0ABY1L0G6_9BACI|nr:IS30 family transposase [Salimicrobium salexigens]SIT01851.1 Transposase and inactivated derivatives, IS30 family [Salimicrobium salexigens]